MSAAGIYLFLAGSALSAPLREPFAQMVRAETAEEAEIAEGKQR